MIYGQFRLSHSIFLLPESKSTHKFLLHAIFYEETFF